MKVKCVDYVDCVFLTKGKVYEVVDTFESTLHNKMYHIKDDSGGISGYYASRFVVVPDAPVKVRCISHDWRIFEYGKIYDAEFEKPSVLLEDGSWLGIHKRFWINGSKDNRIFELVTEPITEPIADLPNEPYIVDGEYHWYFRLCNSKTYVTVYHQGTLIAEGWSRCHPEDTYSAEIGVRKAREQIFRKYGLTLNRDARIKLNAMFKPKDEHFNEPIGDFLKHRFEVRPLRVKCVKDDAPLGHLTLGKIYDVVDWDGTDIPWKVIEDHGHEFFYAHSRFVPYTLADERADARAKADADEAARMIARSKAREELAQWIRDEDWVV
jgi:hypothetical protein